MGLRHVALNVTDVARAEAFYVGVLGFREEWRPDPENLYLILEGDNLAIHKIAGERAEKGQALAHIGIVVRRPEDVDAWATHLRAQGVKMLAEPRTHRDGARSLYCADPDGNAVQILYHPPISDRA
jgi:catechol 2,3-dioxygenase-like lactoylglutathione lyase family enzyme